MSTLPIGYQSVPKLMSIADSSAYFGVSKYFLRKGIKSGDIAHTVIGNKYFVDVCALQRRIDSGVDFHTNKSVRG